MQSVIVRVELASLSLPQYWVLTKGSPEMLAKLCDSVPPSYDRTYRSLVRLSPPPPFQFDSIDG